MVLPGRYFWSKLGSVAVALEVLAKKIDTVAYSAGTLRRVKRLTMILGANVQVFDVGLLSSSDFSLFKENYK